MTTGVSKSGMGVLMVAHIAGMVDLVALPVWVGTLMQHYKYSPQQAGLTVTLFLGTVALVSVIVSPMFTRLPRRWAAAAGYALAGAAFYAAMQQPVGAESLAAMGLVHALAGVGVGCGLSMVHGAMGRTGNPHRMFAFGGTLLAIFAVLFFATVPAGLQAKGGTLLFLVFAALQALAAVVVLLGFPDVAQQAAVEPHAAARHAGGTMPISAWCAMAAVVFLTLNQAMVFSFIERVGMERGFGVEKVGGVLLALGLVNLLPPPLAVLLQKRFSPTVVAMCCAAAQALLALVIMNSLAFGPYALAASVFVVGALFGHIFLFGLIAQLDPSGRATASTPAMMMFGSAIGPVLGGTIVQGLGGYPGLAVAAVVVGLLVIGSALLARRSAVPMLVTA